MTRPSHALDEVGGGNFDSDWEKQFTTERSINTTPKKRLKYSDDTDLGTMGLETYVFCGGGRLRSYAKSDDEGYMP